MHCAGRGAAGGVSTLRLIPPTGKPIDIAPGSPITVGRDGNVADVVIEDLSASRVHAVISFEAGEWHVMDKRSSNGTRLDGELVERGALRDGQELRFGARSFRVALVGTQPSDDQTLRLRSEGVEGDRPVVVASARSVVAAAIAAAGGVAQRRPRESPGSTMRLDKAIALLGVRTGMSRADVRARFEKLRDETELRLAQAEDLDVKLECEQRLQELEVAVSLLAPQRG
jgi:pSer/pThr/pTyr-binding forkhead associated (FHA) protein